MKCDHVGAEWRDYNNGKIRVCHRCHTAVIFDSAAVETDEVYQLRDFKTTVSITDEDGTTYAQTNHPQTSHDAAESAQPQAKSDEALCLQLITSAGSLGLIADEISARVESRDGRIFPPNQVASRLMGLRDKGLIVRGVATDTRKTRRGVKARVHYWREFVPV